MLEKDFKDTAMEKLNTMTPSDFKKSFKSIGSEPLTNGDNVRQMNDNELETLFNNIEYYAKKNVRKATGINAI